MTEKRRPAKEDLAVNTLYKFASKRIGQREAEVIAANNVCWQNYPVFHKRPEELSAKLVSGL